MALAPLPQALVPHLTVRVSLITNLMVHIPNRALVSDASNVPGNHIGDYVYLGLKVVTVS